MPLYPKVLCVTSFRLIIFCPELKNTASMTSCVFAKTTSFFLFLSFVKYFVLIEFSGD